MIPYPGQVLITPFDVADKDADGSDVDSARDPRNEFDRPAEIALGLRLEGCDCRDLDANERKGCNDNGFAVRGLEHDNRGRWIECFTSTLLAYSSPLSDYVAIRHQCLSRQIRTLDATI